MLDMNKFLFLQEIIPYYIMTQHKYHEQKQFYRFLPKLKMEKDVQEEFVCEENF